MIIKITINDNDFGNVIEHYLNNFFSYRFGDIVCKLMEKEPENRLKYFDELLEANKKDDKMFDLLQSEKLTKEDEKKLEDFIRELFTYSIKNNKSKDYIIKNLEVKILNKLECKDENGEVYYYFPTNYKFINQ